MTSRPAPSTFYREIDRNRRNSWFLVAIVALVLAVFGAVIGYATGFGWGGVVVALIVATVMSIGSYFAGDQLVLLSSGAKQLDVANPPDEYKQLINVVTEMSLASGQPMPKVYVIDDTAPNAFATGRDPKHASVAVTRGLLQKMDREELQGVIAHEMSHIGNYDIRFTLLVGVLVGSIALLADWFLRYTFWFGGGRRRDSDRGGGGGLAAILFILAIVLALVAPIIGRLVQLAVSRRREALADVSAVELTRNPIGLARALRTISDDPEVLEVANRATQHLYIVNPIKSFEERAKSMWDTHPPIAERIATLQALAGQFGQDPSAAPR
ncbi:MAG TPA: M48 family metallopeptidase [Candidatus Limnocylindria bacterium]|jgi:heat shock protein HtpX|nr:M48 family metallopeptidase [Candidatus Limnocylindria bacterium]